MPGPADFNLIWLEGADCDGCSISVLGDSWGGGLARLLTGEVLGVPPIRFLHRILAFESAGDFVDRLMRAGRGELDPFGLVVEASSPDEALAAPGFFSSTAVEGGRIISHRERLRRLAPQAVFVIALGDCAVWGGPHSLDPNPTGSTGTAMVLGTEYRSRKLGLPVINLPGCAVPPVLLATLATLLRWYQGTGPALELDELNRPRAAYQEVWPGAFGAWRG